MSCKVNYNNDKFILAPTYSYNKAMWLFEFVGALRSEWCSKWCVQPHVWELKWETCIGVDYYN